MSARTAFLFAASSLYLILTLFTKRFASSTRTTGGREVVLDLEGKRKPNTTKRKPPKNPPRLSDY